jgi:hypothetical protein
MQTLFALGAMLPFRLFFISMLIVSLYGCTSLTSNPEVRDRTLKAYLSQSEPLVFYTSSPLHTDEQLRLFGMNEQLRTLMHDFHSSLRARGLVERFLAQVHVLKAPAVEIVSPEEWRMIERPMDTPVLFLSVDWHMVYQRLPPNMRRFRLQSGVVAKIIPLGQVLSGKGAIALKTASWEGRCLHTPLNGDYFSVAEWRDEGDSRLHQAVKEVQTICAGELSREFND